MQEAHAGDGLELEWTRTKDSAGEGEVPLAASESGPPKSANIERLERELAIFDVPRCARMGEERKSRAILRTPAPAQVQDPRPINLFGLFGDQP